MLTQVELLDCHWEKRKEHPVMLCGKRDMF
jgi:hypothetical protein